MCVEVFNNDYKVTSDFIADSVNTNPVVIRKIMSQLRNAGLIEVFSGTGGVALLREPKEITLLDIYHAVNLFADNKLFGFHDSPNNQCPVGSNIRMVLEHHMIEAQFALERNLKSTTLEMLVSEIPK